MVEREKRGHPMDTWVRVESCLNSSDAPLPSHDGDIVAVFLTRPLLSQLSYCETYFNFVFLCSTTGMSLRYTSIHSTVCKGRGYP
jgi:hypothetical protein